MTSVDAAAGRAGWRRASGRGSGAAGLPRSLALSDQVAGQVRNAVMSGAIRPGEFLRIDHVAADLGISHTPVREAMKALCAEDLVRHEPHRGFVVCAITREDIADLFATQEHLAGELAARAARRIGPAALADLERLAAAVGERVAPRPDAVEGLVAAEHELHVAINRVAASRKLSWLLGCASHYLPTQFFAADPEWGRAAVEAHEKVLTALRRHDEVDARAAMAEHIADGRERLTAHLDQQGMWDEPPDAPATT